MRSNSKRTLLLSAVIFMGSLLCHQIATAQSATSRPLTTPTPKKQITAPAKINTAQPQATATFAALSIKAVKVDYDKRIVSVLVENLGPAANKTGAGNIGVRAIKDDPSDDQFYFWVPGQYVPNSFPSAANQSNALLKLFLPHTDLPVIGPGKTAWVDVDVAMPDPSTYARQHHEGSIGAGELESSRCNNLTAFFATHQPRLRIDLSQHPAPLNATGLVTQQVTQYTSKFFSLASPSEYKCK